LGDYYRRIRTRAGVPKAVIATARKLAVIYYHMLSQKNAFDPKALEEYQNTYREKKIKQLEKYIDKLKKSG
jgi:hypothetical protein